MITSVFDQAASRWAAVQSPRWRVVRRALPVLAVFACIVGLQLSVALVSLDVMAAVRAYVTGESLYSKGQKDAHLYLIEYAEHHREEDYRRFELALAIPIGDRQAREAMQRPELDYAAAYAGLLPSVTDPDDIPGVIRLFRWFQHTSLMSEAIATWTEGDQLIKLMQRLGETAHARVRDGNMQAPEVVQLKQEAQRVNQALTPLQIRFATYLSDGARQAQRLLLGLNLALALILWGGGLAFIRHSTRRQIATEDELRNRRESLQRLIDSAAEGLFGVDPEGRCTFINRSALRMLGYERESQLLGRAIFSEIHRPMPGSDEPRIGRWWRDEREVHVVELMFTRRDGTRFPVEFWSHAMGAAEGELQGAVATFFDISERLSMQAALRQGEVRMANVVDAVNDAVITIDAEGRVVLFNRAAERLFHVAASDAIGTPVERFMPGLGVRHGDTGRDSRSPAVVSALEARRVSEIAGRRAGGETFALEASWSTLDSDTGTLLTAVLRDATELQTARAERQAREALEASARARTEFLSRMSHELRTPLNAVLGFAQLLRLDAEEPPSRGQMERIRRIEGAGRHLLALVNDVLDLTRVDAGQLTVSLESVDLGGVVDEALSLVMPMATAAGVNTTVERSVADLLADPQAAAFPAWVVADRVRLRQVLVNLLTNAIKYNRPRGEVRVSWHLAAGRCEVRIADEGHGIPPDKLARLFEPFNRLGAENSKIEGTGIGLVLTRRLVELMQGELRIESAVGRGTQAVLTLACSSEEPARPPGLPPPSQHGVLDEPLRVLYAEDNEVNVEIVRDVVKLRPGIQFDVAESGARAFQKARRDQPHLMLVDMNLGDMTGIELAKALRADPATAHIRLVALTADALPEQIRIAIDTGFEDYLTKPIDFRELLNVLDGRRDRQVGDWDGGERLARTSV